MRKICLISLVSIMMLSWMQSCAPMVAYIEMEKKISPERELDFSNKKIALLENIDASGSDSLFISSLSNGISKAIEEHYSYPEKSLPVFAVENNGIDIESNSGLLAYAALTSSDILIMVEDYLPGNFSVKSVDEKIYRNGVFYMQKDVTLPYTVKYTVFDADKMQVLYKDTYSDTLSWKIASNNEITDLNAVSKVGDNLYPALEKSSYTWISSMLPTWVSDARIVYVYDSEQWINAYENARVFKWKEAIDIWIGLADSKNDMKAAAAAFNVAVALEVTGEYELADKWLQYSLQRYDLGTQDTLAAVIAKDRKS